MVLCDYNYIFYLNKNYTMSKTPSNSKPPDKKITPIVIINNPQQENISRAEAEEITNVIYGYGKKYSNFNIVCSIIGAIISWNCNENRSMSYKILYSLVAILLSYWYLLFYAIYYIVLKNKCSDEITFNYNFNDIKNKLYSSK